MSDSDLLDSKNDICGGASSSSSSSSSSSISPRTPPNCARFRNHGLKIPHYICNYCRFVFSEKSCLTAERQPQDEARALNVSELPPAHAPQIHHPPPTMIRDHHTTSHAHPGPKSPVDDPQSSVPTPTRSIEGSSSVSPCSTSGTQIQVPVSRKPTPVHPSSANFPLGHATSEVILEYCQKLLEIFHYTWEMMPLMYVILIDAEYDIEVASRRIEEGQSVVFEYCRRHNLSMFDGAELRSATRQ